jgi:transcriptional regulator with XRE-family HTH domain
MDRWSFNEQLFNRLSEVLDISGAEIARRCGLTQQVLNRYMNSDIVLSVQVLMKICNALRMPAYFFVSENNNHVFPNRESATVALDHWHPIEWDALAVELTFGDGEGRIYWKDVAVAMNVSSQKPHERFLLRKRFPIDGFLMACSHFNISPFKFLIDRNRECCKVRSRKNEPSDITELIRRIDTLNATVDDLTDKYNNLLRRHDALLERHNKLENEFRDYAGLHHIDMAAENET